MSKGIEVIASGNAPEAMGPYSQAVRAGGFIFCAGQAASDPATGKLAAGGIQEQTRQVLRNLQAVLEGGARAAARSRTAERAAGNDERLSLGRRPHR